MTQEEALREENRALKAPVAELLPLREEVARPKEQVKSLQDRLAKTSQTSSKPPSSDALGRLPRATRHPSGKAPGGQPGHRGHTLMMVQTADEVISHRPQACQHCQQPLACVAGELVERRQVLDVPEIRLLVREHQVEAVVCPKCSGISRGTFPAEVSAPVQYGPTIQALAVYLHQGQLLPVARTCEVLAGLCGCLLSEGTLEHWVEQAAERLLPTVNRIADLLAQSPVLHGDETGIRVYGMLHWLHVCCTESLTHLAWHAQRGKEAMKDIGIWPRFAGRGMHDRLASYEPNLTTVIYTWTASDFSLAHQEVKKVSLTGNKAETTEKSLPSRQWVNCYIVLVVTIVTAIPFF